MKPAVWPLVIAMSVLLVAPGFPADKAKPKTPVAVDVVKQAEETAAAGNVEAAIELLRKAPDDGAATLRLGRFLAARGDLDLAMEAFAAAATKLTGPAAGEALGRLTLARELRGIPGWIASADDGRAADQDGAWPLLAAAHARAAEGRGAEAVQLATDATAKTQDAAAQTARGHALESAGDLAGAEAALRVAVAEPEQTLAASLHLGRVLRRAGRAAEAAPLVAAAVDAMPGSVEGLKESARVKLALGKTEDAATDATLAAVMGEGDADALDLQQECAVALAVEQAARGDGAFALSNLQRLLQEHPGASRLQVGIARVHIAQRQPAPALAALAQAAAGDAEAAYHTGYVHHMLKRDAATAVPLYEKAVAADPANLAWRRQLAGALLSVNKPDKALEHLAPVLAAGSPGAEALMYKGAAHLALKQYADAVAALDGAAAATPANAQLETFLAWAHFGKKDAKSFLEHGRKAKALGQTDAQLLDYLARVEKGEAIK